MLKKVLSRCPQIIVKSKVFVREESALLSVLKINKSLIIRVRMLTSEG